jgi:probable non-F420 flavinoid oxidoreductase
MTMIGYHASHEQFTPGELLTWVKAAEAAGFDAAMCSDHFAPWGEAQGQSGFAWSWLGAALEATRLSFGTVSAPGYRYHPAVHAQAIATLAQMFPDRFWVALASGEAMNEHITGSPWLNKVERNARLLECVHVIRRLLAGETVTHDGRIMVHEARVWTLPETPPLIFGAALSPETAAFCGSWADGLITVAPSAHLQEIVDAFRAQGGRGKPIYLQVHLSYAQTEEEALANAQDNWRPATLPAATGQELSLPSQFDDVAELIGDEHLRTSIHISSDLVQHRGWIENYVKLGANRIFLHNVGDNQDEFIERFGREILPACR